MFRTFFPMSQALKSNSLVPRIYQRPQQLRPSTLSGPALLNFPYRQQRNFLSSNSKPNNPSEKNFTVAKIFEVFKSTKRIDDSTIRPNLDLKDIHHTNDLLGEMNRNLNALRQEVIQLKKDNNTALAHIAKVDEEELGKIIHKMDESANSRLTIFAAYATILSLLVAILIFAYQQKQEQEKEQLEKDIQEDKQRVKAEKTQAKIEKIQLQYSGLLTTKLAIEDNIKNLEGRLDTLAKMKKSYWWFVPSEIEIGIIKLQGDIEEKKIALQLTLNEINKLDLYVIKQKELEEAELESRRMGQRY